MSPLPFHKRVVEAAGATDLIFAVSVSADPQITEGQASAGIIADAMTTRPCTACGRCRKATPCTRAEEKPARMLPMAALSAVAGAY